MSALVLAILGLLIALGYAVGGASRDGFVVIIAVVVVVVSLMGIVRRRRR